ncbi:hypothetical protein VNO77_07395 [Canavalia gladiata]|uniref:Uncharacterized protein n=1 Tax=Canavalia gladiata TaxID=3824 RepID=A0AAN9QW52_CANGL
MVRVTCLSMDTISTKNFCTRAVPNARHTLVGACNRLDALVPVKPSQKARACIVVVCVLQKTNRGRLAEKLSMSEVMLPFLKDLVHVHTHHVEATQWASQGHKRRPCDNHDRITQKNEIHR